MLKRFRRLPSPALVIASIALILAVGGGSFALAITDKKSDKRIAKRVANKQITKRAPNLSVNHANSANTASTAANANQLGGKNPDEYGSNLWATVLANGTLARKSPHTVSSALVGSGAEVIFDRDVSGCAYTASIGDVNPNITPPPGEVSVTGRMNNPNGVFVQTYSSTGVTTHAIFHLAVHC